MATKRVRRWSRRVTQTSDALDLEKGLFAGSSPPRHRAFAQAFRRSESPSQERSLPLGNVYAQLLHKSRRPKSFENPPPSAARSKG
jgi:hypothetical protein